MLETTSTTWGYRKNKGARILSKARKNIRTPRTALVEDGLLLCPKCRRLLGKAYLGGSATKIEVVCDSKECHFPVRFEV